MPVCRYFLQGTCKFGNNCKFDHPRDQRNLQPQYRVDNSRGSFQPVDNRQSSAGSGGNKFADLVSRNAQTGSHTSPPRARDGSGVVSDQDFLGFLEREMTSWLNSPSAWKLSCFTYSQKAPNLPILEDISPEEVRFGFYDARKRNTLNQFITEFNQKYKHNIDIISQLANPNYETKQFLLKYFHECEQQSPVKPSAPAPVNPFMQIVQQKQQQQQQQTQAPSFFNQPIQQPVSAFQQAPSFSSAFGQTVTQPTMTFQSGFDNKPNENFNQFNNLSNLKPGGFNWSQQQNTQPDMNSSVNNGNMSFQSIQPSQTQQATSFSQLQPTNLFNNKPAGSTNMFSALVSSTTPSVLTTSKLDPNVPLICYSQMNELTPEELDEYKRSSFTLGRLPYNPPPRELC